MSASKPAVGVYVDVSNLNLSGGRNLQFGVLRRFACRDGAEALHLNAYLAHDLERAASDPEYQRKTAAFHHAVRREGFAVHLKPVEWRQGQGGSYLRSDADLDLALDALLQAHSLDRVVLASGDGDFTRLVRLLQEGGCRVELVGMDNVSPLLRQQADHYVSGYLIPNLAPIGPPPSRWRYKDRRQDGPRWGEPGSRVRGWCCAHDPQGQKGRLGFYLADRPATWGEAPEQGEIGQAEFFDLQLPAGVHPQRLPNRRLIFEFGLARVAAGWMATTITLAGKPPASFSASQPLEAQPCPHTA